MERELISTVRADPRTGNTTPSQLLERGADWRPGPALLIMILVGTTLPYLLAWLATPAGTVFTGALLNPDDVGVYVSAMRQGAAGNWLYHFTYSPEPWQPRLMLLPYLLLGKLTGLWAEPTVFWLQVWRLLAAALALGAVGVWLRAVFAGRAQRQRTGWWLTLIGSGVGWLAVLFVGADARLTPDIGLAEWSPLLALFNTPHFALGLGLELLAFASLLRLERTGQWRWVAAAGATGVLSGLTYVYHLAVLGLAMGILLAWRLLAARRAGQQDRAILIKLGLAAAPLAPLLAYYALGGQDDPYWLQYTRVVHVIPPPSPLGLLIGLGGLLPLAVAGWRRWRAEGGAATLPAWALAAVLALYAPGIQYSGRFALGLVVPVAALAAVGLESWLLPAFRAWRKGSGDEEAARGSATLRRVVLLLLAPSTLMSWLLLFKGPLTQPTFPFYLPEADVRAAAWLGERAGTADLVLAYYPLGNYLPRVYDGKVFMGQAHFTTDLEEKLALYDAFWDGTLSPEARAAFLGDWGITHVFAGSFEGPPERLEGMPGLTLRYEVDGVRVYEVREIDRSRSLTGGN